MAFALPAEFTADASAIDRNTSISAGTRTSSAASIIDQAFGSRARLFQENAWDQFDSWRSKPARSCSVIQRSTDSHCSKSHVRKSPVPPGISLLGTDQ